MTEAATTLSYAYAVLRPPPDGQPLGPLHGVDDAPVHLVATDRLAAAVSAVPAAEYDEPALRARLGDLDRLAAMARAHHAVVGALAARGPVLPLRLATVYRGDERVRAVLREAGDAFDAALRRVTGRVEIGLKVYTRPAPPRPRVAAPAPTADAETADAADALRSGRGGSGRDYLNRRRREHRAREQTWERAARLAGRLDGELAGLAEDSRRLRPQSPELAEAPGENVLNAAYLVPAERAAEFVRTARESAAGVEDARVEVTGPWAPYSFAEAPDLAGQAPA
ncbi:GvpL/GvpF family gas vesicle protein [Allostreptomyces psammosilenae]|uniref:Gas vesicle protein n=1 Tax=Allostreptomyces psammosilenae TaxID=1892865 RepID=A0A852ZXZ4_9ACTN|nr:GvpL/GvpF family gas vesicle protein [Allostreptomyces psammosilenae]NYI06110.1 hypothetical protein [Allostreptomyces psammosilenae]